MNDKVLWKRISNDDSKAFKDLFILYYKVICNYMLQFTKDINLAEDLVQEAFIKLWINRKKLQIKTSLKSYLFKTSYHIWIDESRKNKKKNYLFEELKYKAYTSQIEDDSSIEKLKKIQLIIEALPKKGKEIFLLSKKEGLNNREIAEFLNISIKTVESQIRIVYQKIRKSFERKS